MKAIKASAIYLRHPRVFSIFGVIGAIAGTVQDVFIEYASFGNLLALGAIGLFFLIATASALNLDKILREKIGNEWPGIGLAVTALFALIMAGTYYWSENNQDSGGVLAANFENVETFQSGIDAMMAELGIIKKDLKAIREQTRVIAKDTKVIRESSEEIKTTTSNIHDRIEQDPETILKDLNLTLSIKGYASLLARDYERQTLEPLLEIFARHDFTLEMGALTMPGMSKLWSTYSQERMGYFPSEFSVIGAKLFLADLDGPNLRKALVWEVKQGLRDLGNAPSASFDNYQRLFTSCGSATNSCFHTHLLRHRQQEDFFQASFSLAHWAALGGKIQSLEWLASIGAPLHLRTDPGYTPLDVAIEVGNFEVARWLLTKSDSAYQDDDGITYEITALKAFDGVDNRINAYVYQIDTPEMSQWHRNFKMGIDELQKVLKRFDQPKNIETISSRIQDLIEPHHKRCEESVSTGRARFHEAAHSALRMANLQSFGFDNLEALNRELSRKHKELQSLTQNLDKALSEQESHQQKISTAKISKARAEDELRRIEQQRKSMNILTEAYRDTYTTERNAKVAIIRADGAITTSERMLKSIERSISIAEGLVPPLKSEVEVLQQKRQAMLKQDRPEPPLPSPLQNLISTCKAIEEHLNFIRTSE